jgi:hypothetical protein
MSLGGAERLCMKKFSRNQSNLTLMNRYEITTKIAII